MTVHAQFRWSTASTEFDRVLGGGLVEGSVVLIGGDPGIGKSTLLTQLAANMSAQYNTLYVSGEESLNQISQRAQRLGLAVNSLWLCASNCLEDIEPLVHEKAIKLLIVDSIQTISSTQVDSAQGSVSQVRACCAYLVQMAKQLGVSIFIVGHVTKEGAIAGPRVLEHMVDTVLYFEGEQHGRFRAIRSIKNRFGSVNELGVFAMTDVGLKQVKNPSSIFLADRIQNAPGSIVTVTCEGTRPLLLEVQALVDSSAGIPHRVAVGVDSQRLNMLLAVLGKHGKLHCSGENVFINIPGGMRLQEPSMDLPVTLAIASSLRNRPIDSLTAAIGEIGLSGEVRPMPNGELRIREAEKQGFKTLIIPASNKPKTTPKKIKLITVKTVAEALQYI